jgi:integrase
MPRRIKPLDDKTIRAFLKHRRPGAKLFDGHGLFLTTTKAGTPVWRIKFRFAGLERLFSPGLYPEVTLAKARESREFVRADLQAGRDPLQVKLLAKAANVANAGTTFADVCEAWLAKRQKGWSEIHYRTTAQALRRDALPALGNLPIGEITAPMLARVIERVNGRTESTAAKLLWSLKGIFQLAQVQDGAEIRENPAIAVRAVLTNTTPKKPRPALLAFDALGDVLRRIDVAQISPAARMAHRLVAFTVARASNIVAAHWAEFDLDGALPAWTIPRTHMKARKDRTHDHRIPLSPTITAELRRWKSVTGGEGYLFPSPHRTKHRHISAEALEKFFRVTLASDLRGKHSIHGWRSSFSTLAKDVGMDRDAVNLTLDHIHDNEVARAYDRGKRLDQRIALMHWWDTNLTTAQHGGTVIPLRATGAA